VLSSEGALILLYVLSSGGRGSFRVAEGVPLRR
jgi:hypothetical protein